MGENSQSLGTDRPKMMAVSIFVSVKAPADCPTCLYQPYIASSIFKGRKSLYNLDPPFHLASVESWEKHLLR